MIIKGAQIREENIASLSPYITKRIKKHWKPSFRSQFQLEWRRIESLFQAVGAKMIEGTGSRVRFELNGVIGTFHRPHPRKEAKPYQVRDARSFLEKAGVSP